MNYKKITQQDIDFLKNLLGIERVFTDSLINEDFSHDELTGEKHFPEVLVEVLTTDEVSEILKYASDNNIPVTPRGQGTGLVGSAVAICGGIMMCFTKMNKILELDENNLTLTVEPGVLLMDVISFLDGSGLFYSPEPGEKSATIGGNVNTNAGGMKAMKYGATRDNILGLEIVYPDGTIDSIGGKIVKTSSGYNLMHLIIGSEGTLVAVTKIILKLLPVPKYNISLLVPFPTLEKAIETVPVILRSKIIPTALEFMERDVILCTEEYLGKKLPHNTADAYLLLSFDGNTKNEIETAYEKAAQTCIDSGAIDALISNTPERNKSIWSARGTFLEAIKASTTELDECDVVVPRNRIADFVHFANSLQSKYDIRIKSFGHAGDGNLHIYLLKDHMDTTVWHRKIKAIFDELYEKSRSIGGHISGEHGIGYAKKEFLKNNIHPKNLEIFRGIKAVFDPKNILNPGKIV
ncbi:MAG TPA: 2-hydroxy-acid oxidase [Lentisphaeria bacterium]|nr:MAG: 2-hydroxy-acid oxidase [Lentisphaerae bacterium GWF2_38_69]HBM16319.1 2-hydroxy-acid oxidase [Lentisphaeria bacterium]